MQTRRDQVQAYRFVTRRIGSALLSGEPETNELPMRRLGLSMFGSAMVAVIVLAGAGVFGLLTNRSDPLEQNTLVIEEETRARYVYVDGRLHPVENYASARLILGVAEPTERTMSQDALQDIPRGLRVGIPGAPDGLPPRDSLAGLPWRVCNVPPANDLSSPTTTAVIGPELTGGSPLGERSLYAADSRGSQDYLLWDDRRLRIESRTTRIVLGLPTVEPVQVAPQLINAVAAGPDLRVLTVPGAGAESGFLIDGEEGLVGWAYRAGPQHYLLTEDGLVPVGEITAQVRIELGTEFREVPAGEAGAALAPGGRSLEPPGFPQTIPERFPTGDALPTVCAAYQGPTDSPLGTTLEVFETVPSGLAPPDGGPVNVTQTDQDEVATVDQVLTEGGRGALVQALPTAQADPAGATTYLVTAEGIRYPLGGDAATALGYGDVSPVPIPATLVEMIPRGPVLDQQTARLPVSSIDGTDQDGQTGPGDS